MPRRIKGFSKAPTVVLPVQPFYRDEEYYYNRNVCVDAYGHGHDWVLLRYKGKEYHAQLAKLDKYNFALIEYGYEIELGCQRIAFIWNVPNLLSDIAWAYTIRLVPGRGLVDHFTRVAIEEPFPWFNPHPHSDTQGEYVTGATRPIDKCRFASLDYFEPQKGFVYAGYPYR